ncbi:hypothetical protein OIU74_021692 [Salix koriyanagi]|uniref:Uncharacterized protein n=1 Tax=Salix koriyanagi TaxID=2511006 RepID=A0A9Q0WLK2_9ROSI|nr:hypothetical protein OIU74_021692 [Salix koriyanagi]
MLSFCTATLLKIAILSFKLTSDILFRVWKDSSFRKRSAINIPNHLFLCRNSQWITPENLGAIILASQRMARQMLEVVISTNRCFTLLIISTLLNFKAFLMLDDCRILYHRICYGKIIFLWQ